MNDIKLNDGRSCIISAIKEFYADYHSSDEIKNIFRELSLYIDKDLSYNITLEDSSFDISKGIMFIGNPGSGKTTMIEMLQAILRGSSMAFKKLATVDVVNNFAENGADYLRELNGNIFFDDLGFEKVAVHYADKREIFQDVIFSRYDKMRNNGDITHFTSMSSLSQLKQKYGEFAHSRLTQMCNIYVLSDNIFDYRLVKNAKIKPNFTNVLRAYATYEEYQKQLEIKKIHESYEKIKAQPYEKPAFKGSGTRLREELNKLTNKY